MSDFAWECECGNVEYSELAPEECEKCFRIGSYAQLPEELIEERAKLNSEDEFDAPIARKLKASKPSAKAKSKPKSTKPKKRKR
jgi:hypothetical protein